MATVTLKNVYKYYENSKTPAVNDFNLEIKDKEFVVFVGPSGCGKSTTLRMIAGLEEITEGEIYIGERKINDVSPKDRDVAMVFQNYALYPHMSVYKNIAFGLQLKKITEIKRDKDGNPILDKNGQPKTVKRHYTKKEIDERVMAAAQSLEITDFLKRKPGQLSGGQRQRVAIGRAIVRNPHVFLMDEPLSNLDAKLRNQMRSEIILLHKKVQTTFIYVTHDQVEAMTLGERIVIMKDGVIHQVGTPSEVFNQPANYFVAGFIGTPQMNFFPVRIDENYNIEVLNRKIILKKEARDILSKRQAASAEVTLGIRPEHIALTHNKDAFTGKVVVAEMMGSEYYLHIDVDGTSFIIRTPISGLDESDLRQIKNNGDISFIFDLNNIHLFGEDGNRINTDFYTE